MFTEPVTEPFVLLNGPVANVCVRLLGQHKHVFARKRCMLKWYENIFFTIMVLLNGPVKSALFCLMDRYRNVCVRFPKVGTHCCQRGNHRLPLQGTAGSQRLELMLPNLGTIGYHCKELPVPKGWNWWFPTWEPKVTMARNCRFPDLETYGSQPGNQRLPLQGIAGSQRLEFMFSKLSNYHCKELLVAKAWNSWFQTWKSIRYQWKDLLIPKR